MHIVVIAIVLIVAFYVTVNHGVSRAFACVFIPALLLLTRVETMEKPVVLQLNGYSAAVYGILLGWPLSKEKVHLRFNLLDFIVVTLSVINVISGVQNGESYTGVAVFFVEIQNRIFPYFMARMAFREMETRKFALTWVLRSMAIIFVLALVEVRLQPYFFHHVMKDWLHVGLPVKSMAYRRFEFFRVAATFDHPIYFGNACLVLFGLIIVLAKTTGRKLTERPIAFGLFAAAACLVFSLSFTPWIGVFGGLGLYLLLRYFPSGRLMLVPAVAVAILSFLGLAWYYAQSAPGRVETDSVIGGSIENRKLIIRRAWGLAVDSPLLGYGPKFEWPDPDSSLESVDNTYLVFAIVNGQLYMWTWVSMAFIISFRVVPLLGMLKTKEGQFTTQVAITTILALMMAMFTVWAGAYYTVVWLLLLGFTNTMVDMVTEPSPGLVQARRLPAVAGGRLGYR